MNWKEQLEDLTEEESQAVISLEDFQFGDVIGKGGFGQVFRAIYKKNGKECAIKQIFNQKLEGNKFRRYIGEIKTMLQTNNKFLVPFVGFTAEPPYAIITEFMQNGSLDKFIRVAPHQCRLSGTQLTAIAIGITYGLMHLHSLGIIHRDLKSANILIDTMFLPKICDFGIARFEDDQNGMTAKIGTPNYMAPELVTSKKYNWKVDIYSFAMILYEMAEKQRPYKGYKVGDIFQYVVEQGNRPQFSSATPKPLQNLIKQCWSADPDERPSFEEIYTQFCSGAVSFPGTRREEIEHFLVEIERDELKRNGKTHSYMRKWADSSQWVSLSNESSDYYSSSESEDSKEPVPHRKFSQQTYRAPRASAPIVTNRRKVSAVSAVDRPPPSWQARRSQPAIEHDSEYESESESEDQADTVLRNPNHPMFAKYLIYYAQHITEQHFEAFWDPLSVNVKKTGVAAVLIIRAAMTVMGRNPAFIDLFAEAGLFNMLPSGDKPTCDIAVEAMSIIFLERPQLLEKRHLKTINRLMMKRPKKMMILHSYYCRDFQSIHNPWPIIDNLLLQERIALTKNVGFLYVSLLKFLVESYPVIEKERGIHIRGIIPHFVNAKDAESIKVAYNSLASLPGEPPDLDFTRVTEHLNDNKLWESALSLLVRVRKVKPSPELLSALLLRSKQSPKPWIVILHIASIKNGPGFLLEHNQWMKESLRHPRDALRVFLVIFVEQEYREAAIKLPGFTNLLSVLLEMDDPKLQKAITSIIRHAPQSQELLELLSGSGILKEFIDAVIRVGTPKCFSNALALFDKLARIGYSDQFLNIIQILIELLSSTQHARDAITVIVAMSFYRPCAIAFREKNLVGYFHNLQKFDKYRPAATVFLANMAKL